ncbi:MAG: carboxypeptidase regulatory-like domain-containing protein, partial [Verrucomicrobiae bacterium]|nr:carboxypeptidase regulatory-like domain-containing protein [Verrucomicrobiae bacterium]
MAYSHKHNCRKWFALRLILGIFAGLLSCNLLTQEIPPSGTLIVNQADVIYTDPSTSLPVAVKSDLVSVQVETYERFTLVSDHTLISMPGEKIEFPHTLINNGTIPINITMVYYNLGGDDFDIANLKLFKDSNGNGRYDEGEPEIQSGSSGNITRNSLEPTRPQTRSLTLNVNERINFVLTGIVGSADAGKQAKVALIAYNPTMTFSFTNIDTVVVGAALPFAISKAASITTGAPGDEISYSITLTPNTSSDFSFNITVDGMVKKAVIVRDVIPANTHFSAIVSSSGATALYHLKGAPPHTYISSEPADLSNVDAIAWMLTGYSKGSPINLSFKVRSLSNANGTIRNTAEVYYSDGISLPPVLIKSTPVDVEIKGAEPKIEFYQNNLFSATTVRTYLGSPLYIQANAAACNLLPDVVESNLVTITSTLTGDKETFWAIESGQNTGLFRIDGIPTEYSSSGKPGDAILQSVKGDTLTAEMTGCGAARVTADVLVSAAGVVFDSKNNQPVAGVRVTLYDPVSGEMALVYGADGVTPVPASVVTGADGTYEFPFVRPGLYRVVVEPPAGYVAPSQLSASSVPANRNVHSQGSYSIVFRITGTGATINFDIPIDPAPAISTGTGLFVRKGVSRNIVEAGEFVDYAIEVKNVSGTDLTDVTVTDILPYGFIYETGTTRIDGNTGSEPQKSGANIIFNVGVLSDQKIAKITYRVRVTQHALKGNGINRAVAKGGGFFSNEASVQVRVEPGVFTDKGVIIGKVFVDLNDNKVQDDGEPGVPGARLYMEDGSFVITDSEGKYNFYGVTPKTHVLKVDPITLPKGAKLVELSTRNAFSPGTRFVDLKNGELHKADFAISGSSTNILKLIEERKKLLEKHGGEIDSAVSVPLSTDGSVVLSGDLKAQPASGIKTMGTNAVPSLTGDMTKSSESMAKKEKVEDKPQLPYVPLLPEGTLNNDNSQLSSKFILPSRPASLENVISNFDNMLDFIDLKDGDALLSPQINVRIKGVLDSRFELFLNDEKVQENRIGKRIKYAPSQIEAWEYIGINMNPGTNILTVKMFDQFGNQRGEKKIRIVAPDKLGKIKIVLPEKAYADDPEPAVIKIELTDSKGMLVTARTPLTLETSLGKWDVEDLDKTQPGVQTFIEGGKTEFKLISPIESGDAKIVISSGAIREETVLAFMPRLRPMLAVGVIEGAIHLNKVGLSAITPVRERDSFERELRNFAFKANDGKFYGGGRTAFFLKGKIKGEYLLTAAYDSDKDTKERMFRDIQPDEYYPVYGDSSIKGFDAQSTSRLYVRIDHRKSYLLYGDYNTMSQNPEVVSLGNYNRSLTGIREHYEKKNIVANVWASYDSTRQMVEEVPANGTSGPYFLNIKDGIVNSEKVEILTRDRYQPSVILKTEPMSRFTDYEFEPFTGRILFRKPIPSLDSNLNPIYIRVTYELDQGGSKFWVYGADAQVKVTKNIEVGGTAVRDENPFNRYELYSANTTLKLGKNTYIIGEVARSNDEIIGSGNAGRIELRHRDEKTDVRVYYGRSDVTFSNTTAMLTSGRIEGGAKITHRITPT